MMRVYIFFVALLWCFPANAEWALVQNGQVVQIETDKFPVAEPLSWVDVTGISPSPSVGWLYDGTFRPPKPSSSHQWNGTIWEEIALTGNDLIAACEKESRRRVLSFINVTDQISQNYEMGKLLYLLISNGTWTANQQASADAIQSTWQYIKEIQTSRDALVSGGSATLSQIQDNTNWPTPPSP